MSLSGETSSEGRPGSETANHLQPGADSPAGGRVQRHWVHQQAPPLRAGREAPAVRDSDQDLVPEQASQGQEDREGARWSSSKVSSDETV